MLRAAENHAEERKHAHGRRHIYADVEDLVSPGFLIHDVLIGGVAFSLRSLQPGDLKLLRHRVGLSRKINVWKEWTVASSVWMVDGQPLLESPDAVVRVRRTLRRLPNRLLDILFSLCMGLLHRVEQATPLVEAYCYEPYSRSLWKALRGYMPSDEQITGIPGTHRLGLNTVQRIWLIYNEAEDNQEEWLQQWAAAKFVASAHNPKGVKKVSRQDESARKSEKTRRERVIDETYLKVTGRLPNDKGKPRLYRAVTADDLVDEMQRWVAGEKDYHDVVVEAYKEKIRQRFEEEKQAKLAEEAARQAAYIEAQGREDGEPVVIQPLVGYTLDQLAEIRGGEPFRRGSVVYDNSNAAYVYQKYVEKDIEAGALQTDGKAKAVPRQPMPSEDDENSLQERVRRRRMTMRPGPDEEGR